MRQDPTLQKRTLIAFHKPGNHQLALLLSGQKRLEIFGSGSIETSR